MEFYLSIKYVHVTCALLSASLFIFRLLLDMIGKPGWRLSAFRYIPHINDTLLLTMAFTLLALGPWQPFAHQWLGFKILLLLGYIGFGIGALKQGASVGVRASCALVALVLLAGIFYLARFKPLLFS